MIGTAMVTTRDLGAILLESGLKGIVVFLLAAIVTWSLRRQPAAIRHGVWASALALQLALPVLAVLVPAWNVPLLSKQRTAAITAAVTAADTAAVKSTVTAPVTPAITPPDHGRLTTGDAGIVTRDPRPATVERNNAWYRSPTVWLAALYLLGCIAVLVRLAVGTMHVSRMAVAGERVMDGRWLSLITRLAQNLGIRRPLTLMRGNSLGVPVTWGIVYPVVLLPDDADGWSDERRRYVLVHEMAHVKRLDALTQLVGQLTLALFWFNPLTWIAARRLIVEREHACDDYVLRHGTKPSEYASDLLEMVRSIGSSGHRNAEPAFAALAMARRSEFEGRMLSILDPDLDRKPISRTGALMSIAASLIVALPLAAFSPFAAADFAERAPLHADVVAPRSGTVAAGQRIPALTSRPARGATGTVTNWVGTCDTANLSRSSSSNHIEVHNDNGDDGLTEYVSQSAGRCVEVRIMGAFETNADETDITSMSSGHVAFFRERTAAGDRQMRVMTGDNGAIEHTFLLNGSRAAYDAPAQQWFSHFLQSVLAEAAVNVKPRIARLRQQGGVPAVLTMVHSLRSSGAKAAHYQALFDSENLTQDDLEKALQQARRDVTSSGDLANLLERVPLRGAQGAAISSALADAIGSIQSSGDKANTATQIVMQTPGDPDVLLAVMQAARGIQSDGDLANFLMTSAPKYLGVKNAALRDAYFAAVDSLLSSGDRANVLMSAAPYGHVDDETTRSIIRTSIAIQSSGDKANVLMTLASQHLLTTKAIREEFVRAAATVESSGDRANVLSAAIQP